MSGIRIRTDGNKAYREDVIEEAADFWGCNKTDAIVLSCDVARRVIPKLREALQDDRLPPEVVRDLAEDLTGQFVEIDYQFPEVNLKLKK